MLDCDVLPMLGTDLPLLRENHDPRRLGQATQHCRKTRKRLDGLAASGKREIHPQQVAKAICDQAADDAIFTCDVGPPTVWAARHLAMNGKRRLIGSSWHGSMADAMGGRTDDLVDLVRTNLRA